MKRSACATAAAVLLMIGGSSMTGAWATTQDTGTAKDNPSSLPFPVFEIKPDSDSSGQAANTTKPVDSTSQSTTTTTAAPKQDLQSQQLPLFEIKENATTTTTTKAPTTTAAPKVLSETDAKESQPTPTLAYTGWDTYLTAAVGFLFSGLGLAFLWMAMKPESLETEFAYEYSFTSKGD